jgi:hypothetical protein
MFRILTTMLTLSAATVSAGPHIRMKTACQRYGEAWLSGSRQALMSTVANEFAEAWNRLPDKEFAAIPRVRRATSVVGSSKSNGFGTVSVATSDGVMTFVLVGRGFNWRVADIYKPGVDGKPLSVAQSLHATSTVREFMASFSVGGDDATLARNMSEAFWASFTSLDPSVRSLVREWLRPQGVRGLPSIQIEKDRAVVRVAPANGEPTDRVTFRLVREQGVWQVDDMAFDTRRFVIASWREQFPVIGAVASFRAFLRQPKAVSPTQFAVGKLQEELLFIHRKEVELPNANAGKLIRFEASPGRRGALIQFEKATLVLRMNPTFQGRLDSATFVRNGEERDLASLLAARRKLENLPGSEVVARILGMFNE